MIDSTYMGREIKFRVWVITEKKWGEFETFIGHHYTGLETNDDCIVLQFTGLKDKNGREIYEGDIIKQHHGYIDMEKQDWVGAVYFGSYCSKGNDMYETGWFMKTNFQNLGFKIHKDCEIIGNIFENPELL